MTPWSAEEVAVALSPLPQRIFFLVKTCQGAKFFGDAWTTHDTITDMVRYWARDKNALEWRKRSECADSIRSSPNMYINAFRLYPGSLSALIEKTLKIACIFNKPKKSSHYKEIYILTVLHWNLFGTHFEYEAIVSTLISLVYKYF